MLAVLAVIFSPSAFAASPAASGGPGPLTERQILGIARTAAARAGDRTPTLIQHAETSRANANWIASHSGVDGNQLSYLIAERGHFTANGFSVPPGAKPPKGSVLTLVVDASTGEITDVGISDRYPDLAALNQVITDLPGAPRNGRVTLELSPRTAYPGEELRIAAVNDTPRTVFWGGCYGWQRLVEGSWQPATLGQCLALFFFAPHSRTDESGSVTSSVPATAVPGQYRITLLYQDSTATLLRFPLAARAYVTIVPAPIKRAP